MAADKQLIVVVEGTANMGVRWKDIVSDYLEKIVRKFCGNDAAEQCDGTKTRAETFELGLVQFNTRSYSGAMLMRSGWTRDMDGFLGWLPRMQFSGGGVEDPGTVEGLADALMMFAIPENGYQTDQDLKGKRHCILVTASNPYPLPVPVYRPNIKNSGPPPLLSDPEMVAQWFGQCSVSLSVICSRKLPKVRALYEAANRNHNSEDPPVHLQHPQFLVLISESFTEARAALNLPGLAPPQDPVKSLDSNSGASSSSQSVVEIPSQRLPFSVSDKATLQRGHFFPGTPKGKVYSWLQR